MPSTSVVIRETLRQKITIGKYLLEEVIAPKSCQKLTIDSNGSLTKEYSSEWQKNYFEQIRRNLLQEHEETGLVGDHSDEHYRE